MRRQYLSQQYRVWEYRRQLQLQEAKFSIEESHYRYVRMLIKFGNLEIWKMNIVKNNNKIIFFFFFFLRKYNNKILVAWLGYAIAYGIRFMTLRGTVQLTSSVTLRCLYYNSNFHLILLKLFCFLVNSF